MWKGKRLLRKNTPQLHDNGKLISWKSSFLIFVTKKGKKPQNQKIKRHQKTLQANLIFLSVGCKTN